MDNNALTFGGNFTLASAALAQGTAAAAINHGAFAYANDGQIRSQSAGTSVAYSAGMPNVSPASTRLFLWCVNAAGTVSSVAGPEVLTADLTAGRAALQYPVAPRGTTPFGATRVQNASASPFVPGTTAHNAANITTTYINLFSVPAEPIRS